MGKARVLWEHIGEGLTQSFAVEMGSRVRERFLEDIAFRPRLKKKRELAKRGRGKSVPHRENDMCKDEEIRA